MGSRRRRVRVVLGCVPLNRALSVVQLIDSRDEKTEVWVPADRAATKELRSTDETTQRSTKNNKNVIKKNSKRLMQKYKKNITQLEELKN